MSRPNPNAASLEVFAPFLTEIFKRAATDPEFRQLALNDAKAAFDAVEAELNGLNLKFVEAGEDDATHILVLPPATESPPELTEEELDAVAGGVNQPEGGGDVCGPDSGL